MLWRNHMKTWIDAFSYGSGVTQTGGAELGRVEGIVKELSHRSGIVTKDAASPCTQHHRVGTGHDRSREHPPDACTEVSKVSSALQR